MTEKDVFIIHSKSNIQETRLADWIENYLWHWGLSTYGYDDFEWETRGRESYSYSGTGIDPVRFAMKHPEPFIHSGQMEVNEEWLIDMFKTVHVVIIINRGLTEGTLKEFRIIDELRPCPWRISSYAVIGA